MPSDVRTPSGIAVNNDSRHSSHPLLTEAPKAASGITDTGATMRTLERYPIATIAGWARHFEHNWGQAAITTAYVTAKPMPSPAAPFQSGANSAAAAMSPFSTNRWNVLLSLQLAEL